MMAAIVTVTIACAHLGSAVIGRHRAQAAADLAALAAAGGLAHGAQTACANAVAVAAAMRTAVADCSVVGLDVVVAVDVSVALGRFGVGNARAIARAGPVDSRLT